MGTAQTQQFVRQPPSAEVVSSAGSQFENPLTAEQLTAAGLLDSSLTAPQNQERAAQNQTTETLNVREQFGTLFSAPRVAGEQIGLNGIIFDRAAVEHSKQLDAKTREAKSFIKPPAAEKAQEAAAHRDPQTEQEIAQLTREAHKQARKNHASTIAAGRAQTLGLQSEQAVNHQDKSVINLLRQMITDIVQFARRKKQVEAHLLQAQRANKKKAVMGLEGNDGKRGDAIAEMRSQGSTEDQSGDGE